MCEDSRERAPNCPALQHPAKNDSLDADVMNVCSVLMPDERVIHNAPLSCVDVQSMKAGARLVLEGAINSDSHFQHRLMMAVQSTVTAPSFLSTNSIL